MSEPKKTRHVSNRFIKIPGKDYSFQSTPTTQEQWQKIMGNNPSRFKGEHLPVETVSWDDVQEFIKKLNERSQKWTYRLPTEEEWEHACRAGTTTEYYWGDKFDPEYAWCHENSNSQTHPVGLKKPNDWGLYDMIGNVWEWTDSLWESDSSNRGLRGGSWCNNPQFLRPAYRYNDYASNRYSAYGFRLLRTPRSPRDSYPLTLDQEQIKFELNELEQALAEAQRVLQKLRGNLK